MNKEGDRKALSICLAVCLYQLEGLEADRTFMSTTSRPKKTHHASHKDSSESHEALLISFPLKARLGMFCLKTKLEDTIFHTLWP